MAAPAIQSTAKKASASPSGGGRGFVDPRTLMTIRNLEWRARVVVEGFWSGLHRSPFHGFSVEFTEYRPYTPGDDLRYLDWRLVARSDRFFLKKFEDETNLRCYLLVDQSRSMTYGSTGYPKSVYANTLAATLGQFLYAQGDAVGLMAFDETVRDYLPPRHRTGHLRHLMLLLEKPAGGRSTDLSRPIRRMVELARKRSLVVLVSDFLAPIDALKRDLSLLAACGHELVVFQVLDPAELRFEFAQDALFQDLETGRDLYLDPVTVKSAYLERLRAHSAEVERICRGLGGSFLQLATDAPLEQALFHFLRERMRRGRVLRMGRRG